MDETNLIRLLEKIFEKLSRGSVGGLGVGGDTPRTFAETVKSLQGFTESLKRSTKDTTVFRSFIEGQKRQISSYGEIQDRLKEFEKALQNAAEGEETLTLLKERAAYIEELANERKKVAINNFVVGIRNVTTGFVTAVGTATQEFVTSVQNGSSGITIATSALTSAVDFIGKTTKSIGASFTEVGLAMTAIPGKLRILGGVLATIGLSLEAFSGLTDTVKFGLKTLGEELVKANETFFKVTSAGAMFADGVTGFRNAAFEAGISTKKFADAVKASSNALYETGMDIGTGVFKIGQVFKAGGDDFKRRLLNLGYDFQEQAELIAETMQYLSFAGRQNIKDMAPGEIRAETEKYARNLKLISAITGDDAKKRMEQAKQAMANAAVQAELAKMDPEMRKQFQADLALVPEELRTAVLQQRLLGAVVDKNAAIMMGITPQLGDSIKAMSANLGQGTVVMGKIREEFAQNLRTVMGAGQFKDIALTSIAGVQGAGSEATEFLGKLFLDMQKGAKEGGSVTQLTNTFDAMRTTADPLTKTLNSIHLQGEKLTTTLESRLNKVLPDFAEYLEKTAKNLLKILDETTAYLVGGDTKTNAARAETERTVLESNLKRLEDAEKRLEELRRRGAPREEIRAAERERARVYEESRKVPVDRRPDEEVMKSEGRAKGGISTGPTTGYLEKLHGTEAVVPLPDGRNIPVSLTLPKNMASLNYVPPTVNESRTFFTNNLSTAGLMAEVTKIKQAAEDIKQASDAQVLPLEIKRTIEMSNNSLKEVLREQIDLMRDTNDKFQRLMDIASDTRNINQQILNTTY